MIKLIKLLIFGHTHKWEIISKCPLTDYHGGIGTRYTLRCEKCGNIKKVDLI